MNLKLLTVTLLVAGLAGCGGGSDDDSKTQAAKKKEGRPETQAIRNTQAVGVNGKAIADKLDDALTKQEQHAKETEKQSEEQTQ